MDNNKMCTIQDLIDNQYSFSDSNGNTSSYIISHLGGNKICLTVNEFQTYATKPGYNCNIMDTRSDNQLFPYNSVEEQQIQTTNPTITIVSINVFGESGGTIQDKEFWNATEAILTCVVSDELSSPVTIQVKGGISNTTNTKEMVMTFEVPSGATSARYNLTGNIISQYTGSTLVPNGYLFDTDAFSTGLISASITSTNTDNATVEYSSTSQIMKWACKYTYEADFSGLCDRYEPTPYASVIIDNEQVLKVSAGTYSGEHYREDFVKTLLPLVKTGSKLSECLNATTKCQWEVARRENTTAVKSTADEYYNVIMSSGDKSKTAWTVVTGTINGTGEGIFYNTSENTFTGAELSNKITDTKSGVSLKLTLR